MGDSKMETISCNGFSIRVFENAIVEPVGSVKGFDKLTVNNGKTAKDNVLFAAMNNEGYYKAMTFEENSDIIKMYPRTANLKLISSNTGTCYMIEYNTPNPSLMK